MTGMDVVIVMVTVTMSVTMTAIHMSIVAFIPTTFW